MRTLLVFCHPADDSFAAAVRDAAVHGLTEGGHEVRARDLYREGFDPVLSQAELAEHWTALGRRAEPDPAVQSHAADLRWCESVVLVYPTWWAGQPAMLKGWIDRVWINGVAWEMAGAERRLRPALRNIRRITVVTTHGSTKWVNALEGEPGKRVAFRSIRQMCGLRCRTQWIALYNIDRADDAARAGFLDRVRSRLARA